MIGTLEPITGEMLCVSNKDCEILLSFQPRIELRLRPPSIRGGEGQAFVSCSSLECIFSNEMGFSTFRMGVDQLTIYKGRGYRSGVMLDAVLRNYEKIGSVSIIVTR